ncbi:MAG: superinfection immunity protein [Isosphaeraceae bacterium]
MDEPARDVIGCLLFILLIIAIGVVAFGLYFWPTLIARQRNHPNTAAILALNLLLGWTFVGWVIALVWSLTAINRRPD